MIAAQWRSGEPFDVLISTFVDDYTSRPILWVTSIIYGIIGLLAIYAGLRLLVQS